MSTLPETQQRLAFVERENRELRKKLEQIEREHKDLKRAYFQLSLRQKNDKDSGQDMFPMREADEALDDHVINTHVRNEVVGPAWGSEETSTPNNIKGSDEPRSLVCQATLEGHLGAVYTAKFSRKGTYLASGSFDKTVRLWSLSWDEGIVTPRDVATLSDHTLNVSDVSWAHDDSFLVSGAYDKSVKCWDISATRAVSTYDLGGFVLAVGCVPNDVNLIWAASSQGSVYLFDRRSSAHVLMLSNDGGMVNGLDLSSCGTRLFTGDSKGQLRCWDRSMNKQHLAQVEGARPISDLHLIACGSGVLPEGGASTLWGSGFGAGGGLQLEGAVASQTHLLAVNCYDSILRVYPRMSLTGGGTSPISSMSEGPPSGGGSGIDGGAAGALIDSPVLGRTLLESPEIIRSAPCFHLQGHKNKNFPIRSSWFRGPKYGHAALRRTSNSTLFERSLLIATGSVDKACYMYDIGGPRFGEVIQKLEGHTDRVYAATFHPDKASPLLATASADSKIKLWVAPRERQL